MVPRSGGVGGARFAGFSGPSLSTDRRRPQLFGPSSRSQPNRQILDRMPLLPPFAHLLIAVVLTSACLAPSSPGGVSVSPPVAGGALSSVFDARPPATATAMIAIRRGAAALEAAL